MDIFRDEEAALSFYKSYPNRKDWRKPRRGGDPACHPGGGCPYCATGRKHKRRRQEPIVEHDGEAQK